MTLKILPSHFCKNVTLIVCENQLIKKFQNLHFQKIFGALDFSEEKIPSC